MKDTIILEKNIEDFLNYLKYERKLSLNTYKSYRYDLLKISEFFYNKSLLNLNEDDIREFLYKSKEKSRTKSHYITALKSFYNYMLELNRISINPCHNIKNPKLEKKLPKFLTEDEVLNLLDIPLTEPIHYRNKAMLELLYATGIRVSELLDLKLSNYYQEDAYIKVMGKGSKERIIPIGDVTIKYLNLYINEYRKYILKTKQSDYLFINYNGNKMSRQGFTKILKNICIKKNIKKDISPHVIRHTFATHLLNNGANLRVIQELLGHENIETTEIYSHISKQKIKEDYKYHPHYK